MHTKLITILGVCCQCLSLLRVYACVSCSISILFVYMYVRLPSSPRSIASVPSSWALLGFPITAPPPVCVPDVIGALAVWRQHKTKNRYLPLRSCCVCCRAKSWIMMCQQFPRIRYVNLCGLGLWPSKELVCDLLAKTVVSWFAKGPLPMMMMKSISVTILTTAARRTLG